MWIQNIRCCDVCGQEIVIWPEKGKHVNSPMVKDRIWKMLTKYFGIKVYKKDEIIYAGEGIHICDVCMERGLKRPLKKKDLKMCPLTVDWLVEKGKFW